jgi:hypothetical protein
MVWLVRPSFASTSDPHATLLSLSLSYPSLSGFKAFDRAISTLIPVVILEQQFCESVLGLAAMPQSLAGSAGRLASSQHSIASHDRWD